MAMVASLETVALNRFRCDETGWMSDEALLRLDTPSSTARPAGRRALLVGIGLVLGLLGLAAVLWLGGGIRF